MSRVDAGWSCGRLAAVAAAAGWGVFIEITKMPGGLGFGDVTGWVYQGGLVAALLEEMKSLSVRGIDAGDL